MAQPPNPPPSLHPPVAQIHRAGEKPVHLKKGDAPQKISLGDIIFLLAKRKLDGSSVPARFGFRLESKSQVEPTTLAHRTPRAAAKTHCPHRTHRRWR